MSATGTTFKDWNADEAETGRAVSGRRRALLVDDDFSWSDAPPARPRRSVAQAPRTRRVAAAPTRGLDLEREFDEAWGGQLSDSSGRDVSAGVLEHPAAEIARWDESTLEPVPDGPRTVVITGHGAERQVPMGRRQRRSDLRIHERAGFMPDRVAMWAFVLGVVLVLAAVIH